MDLSQISLNSVEIILIMSREITMLFSNQFSGNNIKSGNRIVFSHGCLSFSRRLADEAEVTIGGQDVSEERHGRASDQRQNGVEARDALSDEHNASHYRQADYHTPPDGICNIY